MSILNNQGIPNAVTRTLICVDRAVPSDYAGVLHNPFLEGPVPFEDTLGLVNAMEAFLNDISFPQPFFETRSFLDGKQDSEAAVPEAPTRRWPDDLFEQYRGELATFILEVRFRKNATWQGNLHWIETDETVAFPSTLELLKIIDSAMQTGTLEPQA